MSTADRSLPPLHPLEIPRVVTAVRYRDGLAFGSPHAPPAFPRAIYPEYRHPDLRDRDYYLDVASAALARPEPGSVPSEWELVGDGDLLRGVLGDYELAAQEIVESRDREQAAVLDLETARADLADTRRQLFEARRRNAGLMSEVARLAGLDLRAALDRASRSVTGLSYSELAAQLDADLGDIADPPPNAHARDQRDPDTIDAVVIDDPEAP